MRYRAPWWLPGAHLQTVYPSLFLRGRPPAYRRDRWRTPDGDFIELDWIDGPAGAPLVAMFHGLEGSSASHYASALMHAVAARRWRGVVVHFRGCGGEPNALPRAYHSGDADEIGWILARLRGVEREAPLFATGVSLGGNAMLKWLGREGEAAGPIVDAAAAVSAPVDLPEAGDRLCRGVNRLYGRYFLRT
jgi:predicted alpha/beta-fold hydrolase